MARQDVATFREGIRQISPPTNSNFSVTTLNLFVKIKYDAFRQNGGQCSGSLLDNSDLLQMIHLTFPYQLYRQILSKPHSDRQCAARVDDLELDSQ
jgi:hypothetical protein